MASAQNQLGNSFVRASAPNDPAQSGQVASCSNGPQRDMRLDIGESGAALFQGRDKAGTMANTGSTYEGVAKPSAGHSECAALAMRHAVKPGASNTMHRIEARWPVRTGKNCRAGRVRRKRRAIRLPNSP